MSMPEARDPVQTAKDLTAAVGTLSKEVARLRRFGRHNRWFILVDIVLTVALSLFGALAVHSAQIASRASSAQLALCQAGNVARAQQVGIWDYLLTLSGPPKTPQARVLITKFEHRLKVVFMPRNCARLGQPGGPATRGTR
jgi:hypothetical protein